MRSIKKRACSGERASSEIGNRKKPGAQKIAKIHQRNSNLSKTEKEQLQNSASSQEREILKLLKSNSDKNFNFAELVEITGFQKDSVKRSLSNLSKSDPDYCDNWGRYPVLKTNRKRPNPQSGIKISCYRYNSEFEKQPACERLEPPTAPDGQALLFRPKVLGG